MQANAQLRPSNPLARIAATPLHPWCPLPPSLPPSYLSSSSSSSSPLVLRTPCTPDGERRTHRLSTTSTGGHFSNGLPRTPCCEASSRTGRRSCSSPHLRARVNLHTLRRRRRGTRRYVPLYGRDKLTRMQGDTSSVHYLVVCRQYCTLQP